MNLSARYALSRKARLRWDAQRGVHVLLYPERGLALNATAASIVLACDGRRSALSIAEALADQFGVTRDIAERDVGTLLEELWARGLVTQVP